MIQIIHSKVIFLFVETNREKVLTLLRLCEEHFIRDYPLLIKTDAAVTALYLDRLLWTTPKTSFLPHGIDISAPIAITSSQENNPNHAHACINLTKSCLSLSSFDTIYELDDQTSSEKRRLSKFRFDLYRKQGVFIESYQRFLSFESSKIWELLAPRNK